MAISRKKFVVFAILTIALVMTAGFGVVLAADLVLHYRAERSAGLNRWGYRGPVVSRKAANEVRVAMLGGSTVFGYGVMWNESIPAMLEQRLNQAHPEHKWTVVNLGYNTEGAFAFLPNLRDFSYLDYDLVILYEGYNDLSNDANPNFVTVRQQSPVFRMTGYFPILPLWLDEKALMLGSGGVDSGYGARIDQSQRTVFRPSLAQRASASAFRAASSVTAALERQFENSGGGHGRALAEAVPGSSCAPPWSQYCDAERRAIQYAVDHGKRVLVVSQPRHPSPAIRANHDRQQQALSEMLTRVFGNSPVAYFDVADRVNLLDTNLSFDQMHLSVDGNRIVADALTAPVIDLWSKP